MTTTPEQTPEDSSVAEETVGAAKTPAAKSAKKPARKKATAKKRTAGKSKKASTSKKPTAKKQRPADADEPVVTPTAQEIKDQFVEAAVEPTKKAAMAWSEIVDVAKEGYDDVKELASGLIGGFLGGNKKKED